MGFTEVANAHCDCNDGQHTTASDHFEVKGVIEEPKALMSSQYLCAMSSPDMFHVIYEVFIRDGSEELQRVRALINCATMSIFVALRL
jgi:hypothetical protein